MNLFGILMGCMLGPTFNTCISQEIQQPISQQVIIHKGYAEDSIVQEYVQYAYELGGIEFVKLIECENGRWQPLRRSQTKDYGLCQVNIPTHNVPEGFYDDPYIQLDYCYYLYSHHTTFYGPDRLIKGEKCKDYVQDRFIIQ